MSGESCGFAAKTDDDAAVVRTHRLPGKLRRADRRQSFKVEMGIEPNRTGSQEPEPNKNPAVWILKSCRN